MLSSVLTNTIETVAEESTKDKNRIKAKKPRWEAGILLQS